LATLVEPRRVTSTFHEVVVMDAARQKLLGRQRAAHNAEDERFITEGPVFQTTVRYNGTVAVVAVSGELDPSTAPLVVASVEALVRLGQRHLVVDLDDVTFIDGEGLSALESIADLPSVTLVRLSAPVLQLATRFSPNPNLRDAYAPLSNGTSAPRSSLDATDVEADATS
jgi:anti-anti-sigma factor